MKKLFIIPYKLFLFFVIIPISSCINQEEKRNDSLLGEAENSAKSAIDFNLVDCLNESNQKTIELATITFYQVKDRETLELVLKIKKDHQKIDFELKKITEKNLIIIPKIVYTLNIKPDSLKGKNIDFYFLNLLENQIKKEITIFDKIEKISQNTDFKIFAMESKKIISGNYDALQTSLSIFKNCQK
jgi:hypothetical protein